MLATQFDVHLSLPANFLQKIKLLKEVQKSGKMTKGGIFLDGETLPVPRSA